MGDTFMATSFRRNFKKVPGDQLYCKQKFEVTAFCSSRQCDSNSNTLSRIINTMGEAINKNVKLPKYVVIVIDADLIDFLRYKNYGISSMYGTWVEYLAKEIESMIRTRLDQLPDKAVREGEPFIYWTALPMHANFAEENHMRSKFNASLESVIRMYRTMRVMKLKEFWATDDTNLVGSATGRFTDYGFNRYWRSIDSAVRFNIHKREEFLAKGGQRNKKRAHGESIQNNNGEFPFNTKRPKKGNRFLLPKPH